jgi:hypothetical protein
MQFVEKRKVTPAPFLSSHIAVHLTGELKVQVFILITAITLAYFYGVSTIM